jgi:hypothetical protein
MSFRCCSFDGRSPGIKAATSSGIIEAVEKHERSRRYIEPIMKCVNEILVAPISCASSRLAA